MRSCGWLILKFSRDLSVWAPQYLSDGTWISPKASDSVLVSAICVAVTWKFLLAKELLKDTEDLEAKAFEDDVIAERGVKCLGAVQRARAVVLGAADSGAAAAELTLADRNIVIDLSLLRRDGAIECN